MDGFINFLYLLLALAIVAGFIAVIWIVTDSLGAWDVYKAQTQARQAEAEAARLQAQADVLRERQSLIQVWVLSFASAKDSLLVTFTYLAGGLALVVLFVLLVVLLLERRGKNERATYEFDGR